MTTALFVLLLTCSWNSILCDGTKNITVTAGQNITLECWSPVSKNDIIEVVEWRKPDLKKYVFYFRGTHVNGIYQHPLFHGRVELIHPEMKNGDVSVVLKNVIINDSGTYECRVIASRSGRRISKRQEPEPLSVIELTVRPEPGHTHGHTGGRDEDGGNEGGGGKRGHPGLIAACVIGVMVVPGLILLVFIRLRKKNPHQPAATEDDQETLKSGERLTKH